MARKKKLRLKRNRNNALQGGVTQNVLQGVAGAKGLAIPPGVIVAGANAVGKGIETIAGENTAGITEADRDAAVDAINQASDKAQAELDEDITALGTKSGMSAPDRMDAARQAVQAMYEQRGYDPAEAAAMADKKVGKAESSGKFQLRDIKGLKKFLKKEGSDFGFKVKGGKFKYDEGDYEVTGQRDPLAEEQVGLTEDVLTGSRELAPQFQADAQAGLDYRQRVRDLLGQQTVDAGMDDLLAADIEDLQSANKDINRQIFSELQDTGFLSSSIAPRAFADATTKGLRSNLLQMQKNKAGLRSQNIRDILASEQQLGGPDTLGQYQAGSFVSPTQYGGATDVQGADIGFRERQARAQVEQGRGKELSDAYTTSYM